MRVNVQRVGSRLETWPRKCEWASRILYYYDWNIKGRERRLTEDPYRQPQWVCVCVCAVHLSSTLYHSTHMYISGYERKIKEADYILYNVLCYTTWGSSVFQILNRTYTHTYIHTYTQRKKRKRSTTHISKVKGYIGRYLMATTTIKITVIIKKN